MGPYFAGIIDPRSWGNGEHTGEITLEVMRITLATGLFAIGVELPKSYMAKHAKGLTALIVPTMAIGWVVVAGWHAFSLSRSFSTHVQDSYGHCSRDWTSYPASPYPPA